MNARPLAQGDSELMAQHQDLSVLPPRIPPGQAQHRHDTGDNEKDQLQAHKPKIIARPPAWTPATNCHARAPTRGLLGAYAQVACVFGTHKSRPGGRHGETPRVDPSACVAATAVVRAAVRIGTDARILFGAVLIAEDGVIRVGDRTVVMENAPREVAEYLAAHRIHAWNGHNYAWELTESPGIRD
jgi:hypothetical protein